MIKRIYELIYASQDIKKNWLKNNYSAVLGDLFDEDYCANNFSYTNRTAIKSADYPYVREKIYQQSAIRK